MASAAMPSSRRRYEGTHTVRLNSRINSAPVLIWSAATCRRFKLADMSAGTCPVQFDTHGITNPEGDRKGHEQKGHRGTYANGNTPERTISHTDRSAGFIPRISELAGGTVLADGKALSGCHYRRKK